MRHLFFAVLISAPAFAQVYSWEDRSGVHYTTDARAVPRGARVTMLAKVGRADSDAQPRPPTERAAPPPAAPASPANPSVEREWRDRFIQLHRAITTKQRELSALEVSLPNKVDCVAQPLVALPAANQATTAPLVVPSTRCMPNAMYDRIKLDIEQKRVEVSDAENDLVQLDRRASLEGVPREWRRGW